MTTIYTTVTVTDPDGEPVELQLAAELSGDGEVMGLSHASIDRGSERVGGRSVQTIISYAKVPEWALRQIDMRDLADDVLRKHQAGERGWP